MEEKPKLTKAAKRAKRRAKIFNSLSNILIFAGFALVILAAIALVVVEIYVWIHYGNTPASELPAWVLFFMFGGGN